MASAASSPGAWATVGYLPHPERRINQSNESKAMNSKFDELTKSLAQSVTRRAALKKFGGGLAGAALAGLLALPSAAADLKAGTSTVLDPPGDAVSTFDLYNVPVPPYLDVVQASVSYSRGTFHFEIK